MDVYLSGTPVCGFHGLFEADFGDPASPRPLPRVTPSKAGGALLPFACPRCQSTIDFSDTKNREAHHDTRKLNGKKNDNYFCPSCGLRFYLNMNGKQYNGSLKSGIAPSVVECVSKVAGEVKLERRTDSGHTRDYLVGSDILGCCCA